MQSDLFIGREIGGFTVQERIGRGGMATVYRAYQPSVNRYVALKVITLDSSLSERDEFRQRFAQEAKVIASLEHIHILPIYDYGIIDNEVAFLAMRLLRGGSLSGLLETQGMEIFRAADIFTQMARGLAYAHTKGVIHRDLKPSNILLDDAGNAYLTDFGLAKLVENSLELTKTGHIVGTPVYMSPEQLRGEILDTRSDIYSLGVILYHMLVGRPPFDASENNMVSVIYQHLEKPPVPPREYKPDLPPAVEEVVMTALKKSPADRYDTATEMADALNMALGRRLSTTSYPALLPTDSKAGGLTMSQRLRVQRSSTPLIIGVLVVLLVLMAVLALLISSNSPAANLPPPTIIAGETGRAEELVPTDIEIARAQARLAVPSFIAYITCNRSSEYHAGQAREISDFASRYGLSLRVYDSDSDAYRQQTLIENARTDGARLLIICPLNIELLDAPLRAAQQAGLPMVILSGAMSTYGGVAVVGDEYRMGLEAGRAAGRIVRAETNGRVNAIILDYPELPTIVTRANGLADGFLETAPNSRILGRYLGALRENGAASVGRLLDEGVQFSVILSINDAGSYGAVEALERANIARDAVIISSIDAEAQALQFIREGRYLRATVDLGREKFSRAAVDAAVKLLAGATLPETILVPPQRVITREDLTEAAGAG